MRLSLTILLLATALTGCRAPTTAPDEGGGPPTQLAARPSALPTDLAPSPGSTASPGRSGAPDGNGSGGNDGGDGGGDSGTPARPFRTIGSLTDGEGDAGAGAPGYADLLAIRIEDDGHSARVTVDVGAKVPSPMPADEQLAIGVDLYKRATLESDYQLYAQGSSDGWFAYLTTPQGLVEYPGRFAIGGSRMVFTVPWSSLGSISGTRFSGYCDWDRERPVLNEVAADRAPNSGTDRFER